MLIKIKLIFTLLLLITGCSSTSPTIKTRNHAQTSFEHFVNGTAILPTGNPETIGVLIKPYELIEQENYAASALYILELLPGNNVVYHTLGYSAEKLGYYDAAIKYYEKSRDWSLDNVFCLWNQKISFPKYCDVYDPDKSIDRVKELKSSTDAVKVISEQDYETQVAIANRYIKKTKNNEYDSAALNRLRANSESKPYRSTNNGEPFSIADIFKVIAAFAIIAETIPSDEDSLNTRAFKTGFWKGVLKNKSPKYSTQPLTTYQQRTYDRAKPTEVKAITSSSAGFSLPSPDGQNTLNKNQSTKVQSEVQSTLGTEAGCNSDFNCGMGMKCVKAPLSSTGVCLKEVDEYEYPTFPQKDPSSILPNMSVKGRCSFDTDCSLGYSCDSKLKVCVK
ncbi:tetratricopeptide repeat protein [Alteromonas gilva]|uniref:Tetratricopeptide repeat protein n=1 Tax=Alteromonas gilva TaxID=2987522 RepID=A0ABT5L6W9_9ALTE|nr:tetratricopeptide repeat protein [Alteromonas gilva]MDC8832226.1 tetratricopeptide repeat protein [Alteromonas gilva]